MTPQARLRELAGKATPGPWEAMIEDDTEAWVLCAAPSEVAATIFVTPRPRSPYDGGMTDDDARLVALAPGLALWAARAAEVLDEYDAQCECGTCTKNASLLARLAEITSPGSSEGTGAAE